MKYFIANWKENPKTERQALALFEATAKVARSARVRVVVCPPEIYLEKLAEQMGNPSQPPLKRGGARLSRAQIFLGSQDVSMTEAGAHTGEVGPAMLKRLGVRYAIVGHSERRAFGETDAVVNAKVKRALADGLKVILCVGESAAVHKRGPAATKDFIKEQLRKDLAGVSGERRAESGEQKNIIIAYEPIWAIGTGNNADPEYVRDMALFIKKEFPSLFPIPDTRYPIPVLYGGSVNGTNIGDYVQYKEIGGALVGGASLKVDEIRKMIAKVGNC
jgi:triosephosphate isomerase